MPRPDGRSPTVPRPVEIVVGFHRPSEGSALYRAGNTVVLCTASVDSYVPEFMRGKGTGWLTAEYQMHPRANLNRRENRDGRVKPPSGRTQEIQRLIGRSLRAALRLDALGERTITIDCDVLEADGGTRTASITGGFVALALALSRLAQRGLLPKPVLRDTVAAISVGQLGEEQLLDLVYLEDSAARVDLNLVCTGGLGVIEVQSTSEGEPISRAQLDGMVDLGMAGIRTLTQVQHQVLSAAGVDLRALLVA
ncbi:MAG TPA: ribonuclease PH [Polyangiaceae bacterium]|jgi:ribonuclease PH